MNSCIVCNEHKPAGIFICGQFYLADCDVTLWPQMFRTFAIVITLTA